MAERVVQRYTVSKVMIDAHRNGDRAEITEEDGDLRVAQRLQPAADGKQDHHRKGQAAEYQEDRGDPQKRGIVEIGE
ncbi:hypothetical protein D3C86_1742760 [compost metagenome]